MATPQPVLVKARGVFCRHCGKPIHLSASFLKRETAIKQNESELVDGLYSKTFLARCRRCHREAIYSLAQIVDFPQGGSRTS